MALYCIILAKAGSDRKDDAGNPAASWMSTLRLHSFFGLLVGTCIDPLHTLIFNAPCRVILALAQETKSGSLAHMCFFPILL